MQLIIEATILTTVFISGLFAFRYMNRFFRIIFAQVVVWICFYTLLHLVTAYQKFHHLPLNNQWLMNLHMPLETVLLTAAAMSCFRELRSRLFILSAFFIFSIIFILQGITQGWTVYSNYADVAECILITILYGALFYKFSNEWKNSWWLSPGLILCIGLLAYFACSVPYITMMHYLQEKNPDLNHLLFDFISNVLANIRYVITAIAFWLVRRNELFKSSYE